jgi:TP901 family phage tail tape measure protein
MNQYEVAYKYTIDHSSYIQAMDLMTKRLERFLGLLKRYDKASRQMEKVVSKSTNSNKRLTQSTKGMSQAMDYATSRMRRYATIQKAVRSATDRTTAKIAVQKTMVAETAEKFRHFSTNIASLRSMMVGFYAVQGVKSIVQAGMEFSKQIVRIKANTSATAEQIERIKKASRDLNLGSIFNPSQIAEGMFALTKAGESVDNILKIMPAVVKLSTIAEVAPVEGADMLHSILKQYDIQMEQATHVTDVLAYAQTRSKLTANELYESLKNVGGVAHGLGVPLEQTVAHLAAIKESGVAASKAGTVLMNMYLRMAAMSDKGKATARKLGISPKDFMVDGQLQVLDFLQAVKNAGADVAQQKDMFEIRGIRGAMPMMAWLEKSVGEVGGTAAEAGQNFETFLEGMKDVDGYADRMASKFLTGLFGVLTQLDSAFSNLKVRMSDVLEPVIMGLGHAFKWLIEKLTVTEGGWGTFNAILLGVIGGCILLTAAMFLILIPAGLIAGAISSMMLLFSAWKFNILSVGKGLRGIWKGLKALNKANLISWSESLYLHLLYIKDGFYACIRGIKNFAVSIYTTLVKAVTAGVAGLKTFTAAIWSNTVAWLSNPIGWIVIIIVAALAALVWWFVKCYKKMGSVTGAFKLMGATIMYYLVQPLRFLLFLAEKVFRFFGLISAGNMVGGWLKGIGDFSAKMQGVGVEQETPSPISTYKMPTVNMVDDRPVNVNVNNTYNEAEKAISTQINSGLGYTGTW